jgi:hypothetical protein
VKPGYVMILLVATCEFALARTVPLPRPRPVEAAPAVPVEFAKPQAPAPPSACRLRLTPGLAVAPSLPPIVAAGECGVDDAVQLETVIMHDKTQVAVTPPAIVRCTLAETIVHWLREDVAPAVRPLGAPLKSLDNHASYDCRGRNRVVGAKVSEHGKGNAIDIRSVRLANGQMVGFTDPHVARGVREELRKTACARFATVLGPGSDGYHEHHVHVDLAQRRSGHRMCQWDIREPNGQSQTAAALVPLPPRRPARRTGRQ